LTPSWSASEDPVLNENKTKCERLGGGSPQTRRPRWPTSPIITRSAFARVRPLLTKRCFRPGSADRRQAGARGLRPLVFEGPLQRFDDIWEQSGVSYAQQGGAQSAGHWSGGQLMKRELAPPASRPQWSAMESLPRIWQKYGPRLSRRVDLADCCSRPAVLAHGFAPRRPSPRGRLQPITE
jgi:hypothetical protein